jgi:FixJ family two-component response regulator
VTDAPVISIVDDDPSARDGILDLVRAIGFDAAAFESADLFLQSPRLDATSCLITDMRMPGMTGLELYERLVASGKTIPTIIITAFPKESERARAEQIGVLCYIAKPFDEAQLAACISSAPQFGSCERRRAMTSNSGGNEAMEEE